ncbi:MAG: hypothetical protein WBJ10_00015 [Daejeonella sp.]|uniref:hypothetical protein n=1 Tax=Daejeonella sp. TaxID=2805397 RepID=UPI003C71DF52
MENITEFLFAENMLDEFGFIRYIYHTHRPRALFLIDYETDPEDLVLVDEIDSFEGYPKEEIDEMMVRLRAFWAQYKLEILEEVDMKTESAEMKFPDLDDVVTFSIINGSERPDPAEFAILDKSNLLKMSINGIGFWASILEFDPASESIIGVVQSYLDEEELKTKDHFMAHFRNIWEIGQV